MQFSFLFRTPTCAVTWAQTYLWYMERGRGFLLLFLSFQLRESHYSAVQAPALLLQAGRMALLNNNATNVSTNSKQTSNVSVKHEDKILPLRYK